MAKRIPLAPYSPTVYHCVSSTHGVLVLLKYVDKSGTVGSLAKLLERKMERERDIYIYNYIYIIDIDI